MRFWARAAPTLLLHVNILLVLYAGAGLATGARLKWDPSTYVPIREIFPREYRAAAVAVPAIAAVLLLLAHFAIVALRTRRAALRRLLLLMYAFLMALVVCGEVALLSWLAARVASWMHSAQAAELKHALALREHLQPLLQHLAHWHPLPSKFKKILQEAETDVPHNIHVCLAAGLILALLQACAVLLALVAAAAAQPLPRRGRSAASTASTPLSSSADYEKAPLKAVYRNGRLMMV